MIASESHSSQGVWLENLLYDFQYALSSLARDPGFAMAVIGALALGIGANTAVFSVVNAAFLRPLPYRNAGQIAWVTEFYPSSIVRWCRPRTTRRGNGRILLSSNWKGTGQPRESTCQAQSGRRNGCRPVMSRRDFSLCSAFRREWGGGSRPKKANRDTIMWHW